MSRPKAREFRSLSGAERQQKLRALEQELAELRQKKVSGQLDKPHQFRAARKQIAQLLTLENEGKKK